MAKRLEEEIWIKKINRIRSAWIKPNPKVIWAWKNSVYTTYPVRVNPKFLCLTLGQILFLLRIRLGFRNFWTNIYNIISNQNIHLSTNDRVRTISHFIIKDKIDLWFKIFFSLVHWTIFLSFWFLGGFTFKTCKIFIIFKIVLLI